MKHKVRIVYKSGYFHDFWCHTFEVKNGDWKWNAVDEKNLPMLLNPDNIESVWRVDIEE